MLTNTKRTSLPDYCLSVLAGIFILLSINGCNTRIQGCLDVNADNFNLNAEQSCDDCCTYPSMSLSLTQLWGDRNFTITDTLYDVNDKSYRIIGLDYFLSAWTWEDAAHNSFHVDSVTVICDNGNLTYAPDILAINAERFNYTLGTIRQAPLIDSIHFTTGLTQDISCLYTENTEVPVELTDQSPLWNAQSGSLETMRLIIQYDIAVETFDTIYISDQEVTALAYSFDFIPGEDSQFKLTVDYSLWFKDVNTENPASFRQSIITNFAGSIIRTP